MFFLYQSKRESLHKRSILRSGLREKNHVNTQIKSFVSGNKYLHILTQVPTELRIDLKAWDRQTRYAEYSTFVIGDAESNYTLSIDGYHGDAGKYSIKI